MSQSHFRVTVDCDGIEETFVVAASVSSVAEVAAEEADAMYGFTLSRARLVSYRKIMPLRYNKSGWRANGKVVKVR